MLKDLIGTDMLLPYQKAWVNDRTSMKVCVKSRRIGITWAEAAASAYYASLPTSKGGANTYYISTNKDAAKEFITDVARWARLFDTISRKNKKKVLHDPKKDIQIETIRFASGNRVIGLPNKPDNLRGKKGRVVLDEAAFHEDLDGVLKAAPALLMWGNAQMCIISTHNGVTNPFNQLVGTVRSGERPGSLHEIDFDEAVRQGLFQRICHMKAQEWSEEAQKQWRQEIFEEYREHASEELMCIPAKSDDHYFSNQLLEQCIAPENKVFRVKAPNDLIERSKSDQNHYIDQWFSNNLKPHLKALGKTNQKSYVGLDFGRSQDMTALTVLCETPGKSRCVPVIVEMRNLPYDAQRRLVSTILDWIPKFRKAAFDGGGNGGYLAEEMKRMYGSHKIADVKLAQNWYAEYVPKYRSALEQNLLTLPDDVDITTDHLTVKLVNGIPKVPSQTRYKGTDGLYRHGDVAVSLFLMWSCVDLRKSSDKPPIWAMPKSYKRM
jgi:phage FluMu gp28-like protein